ncbi:hypothetical protein OIO90_003939 [Microbotryomycetes sp. JL221]|nr:hypothetical protein OIO90_003939 [Microbotryomycetes sp. JL221]
MTIPSQSVSSATPAVSSADKPVRNRPRSSSISSGSPGPSPGLSLPTLLPEPSAGSNGSPASSPWTFSNGFGNGHGRSGSGGVSAGWGHKSSLSVPSIVSPVPLAPGSVARTGRHRRNQSVSPPGFPTISADDASGFAPSTSPPTTSAPISIPLKASASVHQPHSRESSSSSSSSSPRSPHFIESLRRISGNFPKPNGSSFKSGTSPTQSSFGVYGSSPKGFTSFSPGTSPPNGHFHPHAHQGPHFHASSHAALLSGIRSHALPHSPSMDATPFDSEVESVPFDNLLGSKLPIRTNGSISPQSSPPFGPTSPDSHRPSPLSLEAYRSESPDRELQAVLKGSGSMAIASTSAPSPSAPFGQRSGAVSPPLLPLPPPASTTGRSRSGSVGRSPSAASNAVSSPSSLAAMYAEQEEPSVPLGQVDLRRTPEEQHRSSPPPEPSLFSDAITGSSLAYSSPSSAPSITSPIAPQLSPRTTAIPLTEAASMAASLSPPTSTAPTALSSHDPFNVPDVSISAHIPSLTSAASIPSASPTSNSDFDLDLVPPPSPVGRTISLPLPIVAPAPLPPHLGGPALHHGQQSQLRRKSSRSKLSSSTTASSNDSNFSGHHTIVHGTEHAPKRHSPLASPAMSPGGGGEEDDEDKDLEPRDENDGTKDGAVTAAMVSSDSHQETSSERGNSDSDEDSQMSEHSAQTRIVSERPTEGLQLEQIHDSPTTSELAMTSCTGLDQPAHQDTSSYAMDAASSSSSQQDIDEGFASGSPPSASGFASLDLTINTDDLQLTRMVSRALSPQANADQALPTTIAPSSLELPEHNRPPPLTLDLSSAANSSSISGRMASPFSTMDIDSAVGSALDGARISEGADHTSLGFEGAFGDTTSSMDGGNRGIIAIDDGTLSMLERIFLCAKSESNEQRAKVAHHLADWLPQVDICEAVEYVLPLLASFATDHDDIVKETFAPQLDRVMWHFFTQCPLLELESTPPLTGHESPIGSPVPSRYPFHGDELLDPSPTATNFISDDSGSTSTPPPTSKTSPSHTEVADAPRISATCFTSLLGALLTDQSSVVAKGTEAAFVRFLCRLKDKPIPEFSPPATPLMESFQDASPFSSFETTPIAEVPQQHHHSSYHVGPDAVRVLEDEFITGIVLGLARLDEEERDAADQSRTGEALTGKAGDTSHLSLLEGKVRLGLTNDTIGEGRTQDSDDGDATPPATIVMSPEEDNIEDDGWFSAGVHVSGDGNPFGNASQTTDNWGETFADSPFDLTKSSYPTLGVMSNSSPMDQVYSSFSPEANHDDEASIGKMVSMSLIGAIAAAECLDEDVLVQQILPEVDRMKTEPTFFVRKEAAQALGVMVKSLPVEVVESIVIPLHSSFAADAVWHVRRTACLVLPAICKRLPKDLRRARATDMVKQFNSDTARQVRSGALEVCGELIYTFYEDPDGVPEDILSIFLGRPLFQTTSNEPGSLTTTTTASSLADDDIFAPLQTALDSSEDAFATNQQPSWLPMSSAKDSDRPIMCAFNFPAVALTVGGEKWNTLGEYHRELCQSQVAKVRQSLASSLHEIAKIIGQNQSDECLFEPFKLFLRDVDHIQGAMLENLPTLLNCFSTQIQRQAWQSLHDAWADIGTWRRREALAEQLGEMGSSLFKNDDGSEEVLAVLKQAFTDPVASVRDKATASIPTLLQATSDLPNARQKLLAFLTVFAEDSSYRLRMTYATSVLATVCAGLTRESFEHCFIEPLGKLAEDRVINVRICVARIVRALCTTSSLYGDSLTRLPLQDMIACLAQSRDRDVLSLIGEFYVGGSTPVTSPIVLQGTTVIGNDVNNRNRSDSAGTMDLESIPTARTNPHAHGICDDDDDEDQDHIMRDVDPSSGPERDEFAMGLDDIDADASMDLGDDCEPVLLERQHLWTREDVDNDFVEVSNRNV